MIDSNSSIDLLNYQSTIPILKCVTGILTIILSNVGIYKLLTTAYRNKRISFNFKNPYIHGNPINVNVPFISEIIDKHNLGGEEESFLYRKYLTLVDLLFLIGIALDFVTELDHVDKHVDSKITSKITWDKHLISKYTSGLTSFVLLLLLIHTKQDYLHNSFCFLYTISILTYLHYQAFIFVTLQHFQFLKYSWYLLLAILIIWLLFYIIEILQDEYNLRCLPYFYENKRSAVIAAVFEWLFVILHSGLEGGSIMEISHNFW